MIILYARAIEIQYRESTLGDCLETNGVELNVS
jgi:hypothetical protein